MEKEPKKVKENAGKIMGKAVGGKKKETDGLTTNCAFGGHTTGKRGTFQDKEKKRTQLTLTEGKQTSRRPQVATQNLAVITVKTA